MSYTSLSYTPATRRFFVIFLGKLALLMPLDHSSPEPFEKIRFLTFDLKAN